MRQSEAHWRHLEPPTIGAEIPRHALMCSYYIASTSIADVIQKVSGHLGSAVVAPLYPHVIRGRCSESSSCALSPRELPTFIIATRLR